MSNNKIVDIDEERQKLIDMLNHVLIDQKKDITIETLLEKLKLTFNDFNYICVDTSFNERIILYNTIYGLICISIQNKDDIKKSKFRFCDVELTIKMKYI